MPSIILFELVGCRCASSKCSPNWGRAPSPASTKCAGRRTEKCTPSSGSRWARCRARKERTPSTRFAFWPPYSTPTWSATSRLSSTRPASHSDSIVMEFATNGDLAAKIATQQQTSALLPEPTIWRIFVGLVQGLKQLHDLHIFHRDIKTANVFLYEHDVAKLGDMNVSKISEEGLAVTQTGTPYYASPEVWKDQPYDEKSDIWSLGCVLYELICLKVPFKSEDMEGLYKKVTRGIYARLPSEYSQELSAVIRSLLQVNAELRPSCEKILKMPSVRRWTEFKEEHIKVEMLKTIKAENFHTLNDQLPKPNYHPNKPRRSKPLKSMMDSIEDKTEYTDNLNEIESLPMLEREKKLYPSEVSDRVMSRDKLNIHVATRDRKKSEAALSRPVEPSALNSKLEQIKELKLPKVQNRYNNNIGNGNHHRGKDRGIKHNQNSLRCHKLFE